MRTLINILIASILFYQCTPPLYIPNTTNVPSLIKKGDTEVSATTGTNGWDLQAAHAITEEVGIMLNGSYANKTSDSLTRFHKHLFSEIGIGYTAILNKEDVDFANSTYIFSIYGGAGLGISEGFVNFNNIFNSDINYHNEVRGQYLKAFLQPSIGISTPTVDFYFTLRSSYVNVYNLETDLDADWNNSYISDEEYENYKEYYNRKNYNIFYEPTLTLKFGSEELKFITQMGFSAGQIPNLQTSFRQRPIIFTIGIQGDFNVLK